MPPQLNDLGLSGDSEQRHADRRCRRRVTSDRRASSRQRRIRTAVLATPISPCADGPAGGDAAAALKHQRPCRCRREVFSTPANEHL